MDNYKDQDDSSAEDVPLAKTQKKPQNVEQQQSEKTLNSTLNSKKNSGKDSSGSDDSSEDEPLIKMTKTSPPAKRLKSDENKSGSSNSIHRTSKKGDQGDSSNDDVPLAKILKKPQNDDEQQQQSEKTQDSTLNSKKNSRKDSSGSEDSSEDEPLIKITQTSPSAKKLKSIENRSGSNNGTHRTSKKAVPDHDDSSDEDIPLTKFLKKTQVNQSGKTKSSTLKTKDDDSPDDNDSSDDEPLIDIAKRLKGQPQARAPLTPPRKETLKCSRKVSKKPLKYEESASDSSEDEPLRKVKRGRKSLSNEKVSTHCIKRKEKAEDKMPQEEKSSEDEPLINRAVKKKIAPMSSDESCDDDDDEPSVDLVEKQPKLVRKTTAPTRRTPAQRKTKAARKTQGQSDESSTDDEPLMNPVKKPLRAATKTTTPAKKATRRKRGTTPVSRKKTGSGNICAGSSGDSSDDKPLIKIARNPHVNKILSIILKRCDVEEVEGAKA